MIKQKFSLKVSLYKQNNKHSWSLSFSFLLWIFFYENIVFNLNMTTWRQMEYEKVESEAVAFKDIESSWQGSEGDSRARGQVKNEEWKQERRSEGV